MAKDFVKYFTELEEALKEAIAEAELVAILQIEADFKRRIFNEGKATNGSPIGKYNKDFSIIYQGGNNTLNKLAKRRVKGFEGQRVNYIELRKKAGRQVAYVDLQFTDKLFNSINKQFYNGHWILAFTDAERLQVARANEFNFKKIIFEPSEEEKKASEEAYMEHIRIKIQELFDKW